MRIKKLNIIWCFLILNVSAFGQDIHFSQFTAFPLNLNPALTGLFEGDYRFSAIDKNQWNSVTVPYKTFSGSADMKLRRKKLKNDVMGAGFLFNTDKAGDSEFGTVQAASSIAYTKKLNNDSTQFLSVGLQMGIVQRSINYNNLTFDNQYNGDAFDPSLGSGQAFIDNNFIYFDISSGINWLYRPRERFKINTGLGVFHLNKPKQSFLNDNEIKLDVKCLLYTSAQLQLVDQLDILPAIMYSRQGIFQESIVGTSVKYILESRLGYNTAMYFGSFYRLGDAVILSTGIDYNDLNLGISYDINTSGLKAASNGRGGFEISLTYIIRKFIPLESIRKPCPTFL